MSKPDAPRAPRFGGAPVGGGFGERGISRAPDRSGGAFARGRDTAGPSAPTASREGPVRRPVYSREAGDSPLPSFRTRPGGPKVKATGDAAEVRPKKARGEKAKFEVTCVTCGTQTTVPFRPIEGRDIFCQPCYQARRGQPKPEVAPASEALEPRSAEESAEANPVEAGDDETGTESTETRATEGTPD